MAMAHCILGKFCISLLFHTASPFEAFLINMSERKYLIRQEETLIAEHYWYICLLGLLVSVMGGS
jgi:hypothetical protein